jgi:hypothetical protein
MTSRSAPRDRSDWIIPNLREVLSLYGASSRHGAEEQRAGCCRRARPGIRPTWTIPVRATLAVDHPVADLVGDTREGGLGDGGSVHPRHTGDR